MNRLLVLLAFPLAACSTTPRGGDAPATATSAAPTPPAAPPSAAALPASTTPIAPASTAVEPTTAPPASASANAPVAPAAPPAVDVKNIGMHIGGGPNDAPTKGPFKRSVEPHFGELAACWANLGDPKASGDVSLDLRVEKDGGAARVTKTKAMLGDETFRACIVDVIQKIDFEKPRGGATVVSYSLRFTPKKVAP